ncbi:MAG TPA: hypothetical protein VFT70_06240 [Nocardioides sp.]|nr:hypothetical protein [Nocardioides sp.]
MRLGTRKAAVRIFASVVRALRAPALQHGVFRVGLTGLAGLVLLGLGTIRGRAEEE